VKRFLFAFICASTSIYGSAIVVTNPATLQTNDILAWSQLPTHVSQYFSAMSNNPDNPYNPDYISGHFTNGGGTVETACGNGCSFTANNGIAANDALLLSSTGNNQSAPLTLSFSPEYGLGAYIQAATMAGDSGTQFTARIQAFAGVTSVLDATITSNMLGNALFLGVQDSVQEITRVIFSVTDAHGISSNFLLDTVYLQNTFAAPPIFIPPPPPPQGAAPEPVMSGLVGSALLALVLGFRKRTSRA
jgi:hypothetical protein